MQKRTNEIITTEVCEGFDLVEEERIRDKLDEYVSGENWKILNLENKAITKDQQLFKLKRLGAKLELRNRKRKLYLKLFDIDSYTNELIDREKANTIFHNRFKKETPTLNDQAIGGLDKSQEPDQDNADVIFECKTLKTNISEKDSSFEIIEITRILDRFKNERSTLPDNHQNDKHLYYFDQMPIGCVESRNEDIKCILSPYTNKSVPNVQYTLKIK